MTIDQALHKQDVNSQSSPELSAALNHSASMGRISYKKEQLADGRVSLRMKARNEQTPQANGSQYYGSAYRAA